MKKKKLRVLGLAYCIWFNVVKGRDVRKKKKMMMMMWLGEFD